MRKLITVVVVLAVCVVGFGFYRGWFALSSPSSVAGRNDVNVNLATDTDKMKADAETVKDKAAELTGNVTHGRVTPDGETTGEVPATPAPTDDGPPPAEAPDTAQSDGN